MSEEIGVDYCTQIQDTEEIIVTLSRCFHVWETWVMTMIQYLKMLLVTRRSSTKVFEKHFNFHFTYFYFRLPKFWHRTNQQKSHIAHYSKFPIKPNGLHSLIVRNVAPYIHGKIHICSTLGHGWGLFWCPNVGWFRFKISPMACTPILSQNPLSKSIIVVTIDMQSLSHIGISKMLLAQYHEPHAPIFARTNHHIPHTTVLCDNPASNSRRFTTVWELRSWSCIASSTFLLAIQPISRT